MDVPREKGKLKCLWFLNIAFNQMLRNQIVCAKKGSPQIYAISHFCSGCKNGDWRNCILLVGGIHKTLKLQNVLDLAAWLIIFCFFFANSHFWKIFTQIQTVWTCWLLKICADVRIPFSRNPLFALLPSKNVVLLVHWFHRELNIITNTYNSHRREDMRGRMSARLHQKLQYFIHTWYLLFRPEKVDQKVCTFVPKVAKMGQIFHVLYANKEPTWKNGHHRRCWQCWPITIMLFFSN